MARSIAGYLASADSSFNASTALLCRWLFLPANVKA